MNSRVTLIFIYDAFALNSVQSLKPENTRIKKTSKKDFLLKFEKFVVPFSCFLIIKLNYIQLNTNVLCNNYMSIKSIKTLHFFEILIFQKIMDTNKIQQTLMYLCNIFLQQC